MKTANVTQKKLKESWDTNLTELQFTNDYKLECLHEQHRVIIDEQYLYSEENKWWVVNLYNNDKSFV